jgi:hypothetical protein
MSRALCFHLSVIAYKQQQLAQYKQWTNCLRGFPIQLLHSIFLVVDMILSAKDYVKRDFQH